MTKYVEDDTEALVFKDTYYTRSFDLEKFSSGYKLVGMVRQQPILPGVNKSQCFDHLEDAPIRECSCGFYAYLECNEEDTFTSGPNHVRAIIRGSGKTIIQEHGVRLENIEVMALSSIKKSHRKKLRQMFPEIPVYNNDRELFEATKNIYHVKKVEVSISERTPITPQTNLTPRLQSIAYYEKRPMERNVLECMRVLCAALLSLVFVFIALEAITFKSNVFVPPEIVFGLFGFWCAFSKKWSYLKTFLGVLNICIVYGLLVVPHVISSDEFVSLMNFNHQLFENPVIVILAFLNVLYLVSLTLKRQVSYWTKEVLYKPRVLGGRNE